MDLKCSQHNTLHFVNTRWTEIRLFDVNQEKTDQNLRLLLFCAGEG